MGENPKLSVGDSAPSWELESDNRGTVTSGDLAGQRYVLYFYPKDDTPGCTKQACDFRDNIGRLQEMGWAIFGVSPDSVESHRRFRDKHDLNFTLLADPDKEVASKFGVWREKTNYGRTYEGIVRSTFLIEKDGTILDIQDNVRATGHVERLLRQLAEEEGV